jgi:hypothetical protein
MRLPSFDLCQGKNSIDLCQHSVQLNRVVPKGHDAGLWIELLEAVTCRHPYHRVGRTDHAPQIVAMLRGFEPPLDPFIEVFKVISKVGISERGVIRNAEAVSKRSTFRFLTAATPPKEFRQVGSGDQEALKGDERPFNISRHKGLIDVERCDGSRLALKGNLVLKDSQDESLHVGGQFGGRFGCSRFWRFSSSKRASSLALGTAKTCLTNSSNLARGSRLGSGLLPNGFFPDQLPVGDPLANDSRRGRYEPRGVRRFARVEAICRLVQVAVKVLGINGMVSPEDHALEQRPEVLQAVRVDTIPNVTFGVVDDFVDVVASKPLIRPERVRVDVGAGRNACANLILNGLLSPAWNDPSTNLSVALQQAHDGHLAHVTSTDVLLLVLMLEARFAANKSLVGLNLTRHRAVEVTDLHGKANAVRHEPRRFLSHAEVSRELVRRDALLESRVHPQRRKPLGEGDRRVLKDGALLDGELVLASLAAPQRARRNEAQFLGVTAHTLHAVRPAKARNEVSADGLVREVSDRSDEGFGELRHE